MKDDTFVLTKMLMTVDLLEIEMNIGNIGYHPVKNLQNKYNML